MTEQQINKVYLNCNRPGVDMEDLLRLCLDPDTGINIDGLRAAKYNKIDQLEERYNVEVEDITWIRVSSRGTIEDLSDYIKKVNQGIFSNAHLAEAKTKLRELAATQEDNEWRAVRASDDLNDVMAFIAKIKDGVYSDNYLRDALVKAEFMDWTIAKNSHDSMVLNGYLQKCNTGFYPVSHASEAKDLIEEWESGSIIADWNQILSEPDVDKRMAALESFVFRYNTNPSQTAIKYVEKAGSEETRLKDEKIARKDWIDATQTDDILGYVEFITKHPYCDYREEADRRIESKKSDLLSDMKRFPFKYSRDDMYKYISSNTLTWNDLVENSHVLTDKAFSHIREYPTLLSEQGALPVSKILNPESADGNTDVYFFGVPGSGKSCVLAGLMAQNGELGFSFDPKGQGGGGNYAISLRNFAKRSMLPPKTDDLYIQVIDAEINDQSKRQYNISIIEMAGERTAAFAALDNSEDLSDLGPGAEQLLSNNNNKVIFFVIDPTNEKNIKMSDDSDQWFMQSDVLNCISSLLMKNKALLKKIVGIHVILTKSDTLGEYVDSTILHDVLTEQGYSAVLMDLQKICKQYNINRQTGFEVGIYPFCVGRFMPGNVYTYDGTDSLKILRVIQENCVPRRVKSGWGSAFKDFFNS